MVVYFFNGRREQGGTTDLVQGLYVFVFLQKFVFSEFMYLILNFRTKMYYIFIC